MRGLTLNEMLIVLAVFSILTLLFLVTSQEVMVRTRAARVANDHRVLADQIALYAFDRGGRVPTDPQGLFKILNPYRIEREVPVDPFSVNRAERETYAYYANLSPEHRWIIVSRGPNGTLNVDPTIRALKGTDGSGLSQGAGQPYLMTPDEADEFIRQHTYDPTNGTNSAGDIITIERRRH